MTGKIPLNIGGKMWSRVCIFVEHTASICVHMRTEEIDKKEEKTLVEELREIRDKISLDIQDLTAEQMKEYFSKQKTLRPTSLWRKMGLDASALW